MNKKVLFSFFILFSFSFYFFAQTNSVNNESSVVASSFDENSTDYFSNNSSTGTSDNSRYSSRGSTAWMFFRMILVLVIVCGLIYGVFWFIKHKTKIVQTDSEFLRRAAFITIGQNKTVEVITLIDKAYLIGVTDEKITLLGEIEDKELIESLNLAHDKKQNVKNPVNFNEVLEMFTRKTKKTSENQNNDQTSAEKNLDQMINQLDEKEEK